LEKKTSPIYRRGAKVAVTAPERYYRPGEALRTWLMNLPYESVTSWKDLSREFVANFMPTYEHPAMKNDLKAVSQYKGKTLRQYI
jgi:hypothetical protein